MRVWETMDFTEKAKNNDIQNTAQWLEHASEIPSEELAKKVHLANEHIAEALRWTKPVISTPRLTK